MQKEEKTKILKTVKATRFFFTFSDMVPDTSVTFWDATSVNFHPTSATFPPSFEAPMENADKLWRNVDKFARNKIRKLFTHVC